MKIQGIQHEFTTIPGVNEDVTDIVLNLKQLRVAMNTPEPQKVQLIANAKGVVTAAAIVENQHIRILNPDLHIATLSEDIDLVMDLEFRMGKGYVPAEMHEDLDNEIGVITLDSSFSPIRKVAYAVEQARVGQMTNYDKLIMEVWTDGSVSPEDALAYSAKILKDQLSVFINFDEGSADIEKAKSKPQDKINENLFKNIEDLELPVLEDKFNIEVQDEVWSFKESKDPLNDIIFNLTPFQQSVYDEVNNSSFEDIKKSLIRFKSKNFDEKIQKNLEDLIKSDLIVKNGNYYAKK